MTQAEKNTIVIYHGNCADGLGAAWACWQKFDETADYLPCQYGIEFGELMMDYLNKFTTPTGEDHPKEFYSQKLDVYIVDFSFPRDEILHMADFCKTITVLDHHKSAQDELTGPDKIWPPNVLICFDMNRSGAGLTWDILHGSANTRPEIINLIEDRDLWRFNFHASKGFHKLLTIETDNFHADLKSFKYLDNLHKNHADFSEAVLKGLSVQDYHDSVIAQIANGTVQHVSFENYIVKTKELTGSQICLAAVINAPYFAVSDLGDYLGEKVDLVISWHMRNNSDNLALSFRSKNGFNCAEFAKKYFNGGGPEAAAGGHCSTEKFLEFLNNGKLPDDKTQA